MDKKVRSSEFRSRSIMKAFTWRIIATLTTVFLVFVVTGSFEIAGTVGIFDIVLKLFFYYVHERTWGSIGWGKEISKG